MGKIQDAMGMVSRAEDPVDSAQDSGRDTWSHWLVDSLGLGCYIAWSFIFWNSPVLFAGSFSSPSMGSLFLIQGFLTAAAALAIALCANRLTSHRRRYLVFGVLALLSSIAVALAVLAPSDGVVLRMVGVSFAISGIGSCMRLVWEERVSYGGVGAVVRLVVVAYLIGYAMFVSASLFTGRSIIAIACLLPMASFALLLVSERRFGVDRRILHAAPATLDVLFGSIPFKYVIVIALVFFGYGVARTSGVTGGYLSQAGLPSILVAGGPALASVVGILLAAAFHHRPLLAFYIAFPLMALAALIPVSLDPFSGGTVLCVTMVGAELVKYLIWFIFIGSMTKDAVSALFCLALMRCAQWLGSTAGQLFSGVLPAQQWSMAAVLISLIVALLLVMGMPAQQSAVEEAGGNSISGDRVPHIVELYGLSPREAEVFAIWVEGYSSPYIEKHLFISKSTVKTHLNHIYAKTGTANREELLELLKSI